MFNDCITHRLEPPIQLEHVRDPADTLSSRTVDTEDSLSRDDSGCEAASCVPAERACALSSIDPTAAHSRAATSPPT